MGKFSNVKWVDCRLHKYIVGETSCPVLFYLFIYLFIHCCVSIILGSQVFIVLLSNVFVKNFVLFTLFPKVWELHIVGLPNISC